MRLGCVRAAGARYSFGRSGCVCARSHGVGVAADSKRHTLAGVSGAAAPADGVITNSPGT